MTKIGLGPEPALWSHFHVSQVLEPLEGELSDSNMIHMSTFKQPKSKDIILNLKPSRTNNKA